MIRRIRLIFSILILAIFNLLSLMGSFGKRRPSYVIGWGELVGLTIGTTVLLCWGYIIGKSGDDE